MDDESNQNHIKLFQNQQIRAKWDNEIEDYYFSVIDVVGVLSESKNPSAYWRKLKQRLSEEGNQSVTNCHKLKLPARDGKLRKTDVADSKQILRIIQSIPSPNAEPFKRWFIAGNARKELEANTGKKVISKKTSKNSDLLEK